MSVFISHSRFDSEFVEKLCLGLVNLNVKVWRDQWKMSPGDLLPQRIKDAINQATVFCVVVSSHSSQSEWVARELDEAFDQEKKRTLIILPLIFEDCKIPEALADRIQVDFRKGFDRGLTEVQRMAQRGYEEMRSGSAGGGSVYPFIIHWAREVTKRGGCFFLQLDTVSVDAEADHVVLAQFMFQGNEAATSEQLELTDGETIDVYLIKACAENFREHPARINLKSSDVFAANFTIQDGEGIARFEVSVRARRVGKHSHTTQIFNLGGTLIRVYDAIHGLKSAAL